MKKPKRLALLSSLLILAIAVAIGAAATVSSPRAVSAQAYPDWLVENVRAEGKANEIKITWEPPRVAKSYTVGEGTEATTYDAASGVSKYVLRFENNQPRNISVSASNQGRDVETTVSGLQPGRRYHFTIQTCFDGTGGLSGCYLQERHRAAYTAPKAPLYLSVDRARGDEVSLSWAGGNTLQHVWGPRHPERVPLDFYDRFECLRQEVVPGVNTVASDCDRTVSDRAKTIIVDRIDPEKVYKFRVRHKERNYTVSTSQGDATYVVKGSYEASPWREVTVGGPPKAPANVRITGNTGDSVTLAWDAVTQTTTDSMVVGNVRYLVAYIPVECNGRVPNPDFDPDSDVSDENPKFIEIDAHCPDARSKWGASATGTTATVSGLDRNKIYQFSVLSQGEHRIGQATGWVVTCGLPRSTQCSPPPPPDDPQPAKRKATITVTAADPVTVNEGGAAAYTVGLGIQPTGNVVVRTTSDNADVATQPASLTFTPDNWQTAQTVNVRAAHDDDAVDDAATVSHAVSGADEYSATGPSVTVAVIDDDTAGVTVSKTSLSLTEGGTATYTVVLDAAPVGQVLISPFTYGVITAQPQQLTFTPENWRTPQTVTVSAAQDDDADDEQTGILHFIGAGTGSGYVGVAVPGVDVSVTDDDEPAAQPAQQPEPEPDPGSVTVSAANLPIGEGATATYTVALDVEPTANVTITVSSDNGDVTTQPASLTFTPDNWQTAQTVTVSAGQDDDAVDESASVSHAASGGNYDGVAVASVTVSVTDDEPAAQPAQQPEPEPGSVTVSAANLPIREGGSATYTVALDVEPTENVTITVSSDNGDVTTQPSSLTFTTGNWQSAQTVSVSAGQDSDESDDTATLSHAASGGNYDGVTVASVAVSVTDDDSDREILQAFYNATGGSGWSNKGNWGSDKPLSQWHGVTANGSGQVTHLSLRNNGLSGSLPSQLGKLDSLQVLSLDRNSISGSLPSELGNLSNLTRLAMNRNNLSGSIPSQLGNLSNLSIIGLARNSLSGSLPASLGNLSGLTKVSLHDNTALSGSLPSGFTNLANLQRLAIANTGLCAPDTQAFDDWLAGVPDKPGGVATCE